MKITWIGHACFKVESNNYSLIIDPYQPGSVPGIGDCDETANAVYCSHGHHDHNAKECVTIVPTGAPAPVITEIHTYHDEVQGSKRGANIIHIIDFGTEKIAHLGDLGCELPADQMDMLRGMDAILVPIGGFFTIDGTQAAKLISQLQPKHVIPMHYRDDEAPFGFGLISTVVPFVEAITENGISDSMLVSVEIAGSVIDTRDEHSAVIIMEPARLN